jgi:transcriptional regulator with XRE-family HTH domain
MDWGKELRAFRQRTGLKQEAAAHLLGVSQAYVSRLENATAAPSASLEAKLNRLLKEPEHRPMFEHFRATVSHSPHIMSLLTEQDGEIIVDAASEPLLQYGAPYHNIEQGKPVTADLGAEAMEILQSFVPMGAFAGEVASIEVVWSYDGDEGEVSHWHTTQIPVRNDAGRWYLHGTHVPISEARKLALTESWGGEIKTRSFDEDPSQSQHETKVA